MKGRKPAVSPGVIIEAVLHFKEKVITEENGEKRIAVPTNRVWDDIQFYLNGTMSKIGIYTFVHKGRHGIKEKLGLTLKKNLTSDISSTPLDCYESDASENSISTRDEEYLPKKKIVFTFSPEEWEQIQPQPIVYKINDKNRPLLNSKSYYVLSKNTWTPLLAEHFWVHTHLQCSISFRRAKVNPNGIDYITVVGRCSSCESKFKGTVRDKPTGNSRVLMHCLYVGNFNDDHSKTIKKRRLIGPTKKKALLSILDGKIACETYREKEANRLMNMGNPEPPIIPSGNALRLIKSKNLKSIRRHSDSITAIFLMKLDNIFKDCLHDIGIDPFFLHFHTPEQINLYRAYSRQCSFPSLIVDASGSVVKRFSKFGLKKTQIIYLYEAVIYDDVNSHTFTVSSMVSEKHDNIAIYNWLSNWLKNDIPSPKEVCSDMSLALLSALVRSFTQYTSLSYYISVCSQLLLNKGVDYNFWLPKCFVRIDTAHFIKNMTKWSPFSVVSKRVKEVYLRAICLIIKCQNLSEIRSLLYSLFVVASNESDGYKVGTSTETQCEVHKRKILGAVSLGCTNSELDELLLASENIETSQLYIEEGLEEIINPFLTWANTIYEETQSDIEEGTGLNPLYLPSIIPLLKKEIKLLPLWSGVMIPIFGYGNQTKSSAAVESMFNKVKNIVFKDIDLPTSLETFIERRIISLKGSSLLKNGEYFEPKKEKKFAITSDSSIQNDKIVQPFSHETINTVQDDEHNSVNKISCSNDSTIMSTLHGANNTFEGTLSENDECRMISDHSSANNFTMTSISHRENNVVMDNENEDESLLNGFTIKPLSRDMSVVVQETNSDEESATENWNRKNDRKRKIKSYLSANPHLKFLNLNSKKQNKSLPLLKNGSRAEDLKALQIKGYGKIILSNTCAFDTAVFLIMVAICDSEHYLTSVDEKQKSSIFTKFVTTILSKGITVGTYRKRAQILIDLQKPKQTPLKYNQMLLKCETTFNNLLKCILPDLPTIYDITECEDPKCIKNNYQYTHLTYMYNDNFNTLEEFINERTNVQKSVCENLIENNKKCKNIKTLTPVLSKEHIFIEVIRDYKGMIDTNSTILVELSDIPPLIKHQNINYELRGVCSFIGSISSVGHYKAYCTRIDDNWELFDDLNTKSIPIKTKTQVPCEYIFYTI